MSSVLFSLRRVTKQWLRMQLVESVLVYGLLAVFAALWITGHLRIDSGFFHNVGYYSFFGLGYLQSAVFPLVLYLSYKFVVIPVRPFLAKRQGTKYEPPTRAVFVQVLMLVLCFMLLAAGTALLLDQIYRLPAEKIAWASSMVNSWDLLVFGSYVPFALQQIAFPVWFAQLAIGAYKILTLLLSATFVVLMVASATLFRKFVLAFFLAPLLCAPLWYLIPAISPGEMYVRQVTGEPPPEGMLAQPTDLAPEVWAFHEQIMPHKSRPDIGMYSNTAFPSMHVAWGMIIVWFGFLLWRPLLLILAPWQLLNMFGAVYTLQHYAIDLIAGLLIALVVLVLIEFLLTLESRLRMNVLQPHSVIAILHNDLRTIPYVIQRYTRLPIRISRHSPATKETP